MGNDDAEGTGALKRSPPDWRSYDGIADRYDDVASPRFRAVAERMWALLPPPRGVRTLDVGTGTGIVAATGAERGEPGLGVGCDRAAGMLRQARDRAPWLRVLVADAVALPFPDEIFDIVTASFVLSHVRDHTAALREVHRVLKPKAVVAVSSWAEASDPFGAAWREYLEDAVGANQVERAMDEVIPAEGHFAQAGELAKALTRAGLSVTTSDSVDLDLAPGIAQFVEDRALTPAGRLAQALLGDQEWARFTARCRDALESRFGPRLRYKRRAFIVVAAKAASGRRPPVRSR